MFDSLQTIYSNRHGIKHYLSKIPHIQSEEKIICKAYYKRRSSAPLKEFFFSPLMIILYILLGLMCFCIFFSWLKAFHWSYTVIQDANCRTGAGTSFEVAQVLHKGDVVTGKLCKKRKWIEYTSNGQKLYISASLVEEKKPVLPISILYAVSVVPFAPVFLIIKYMWVRILFCVCCALLLTKIIAVIFEWKNQYPVIEDVLLKICAKCYHFSVSLDESILLDRRERTGSRTIYRTQTTISSRTGNELYRTEVPLQDIYTESVSTYKDIYKCKRCGYTTSSTRISSHRI